MILSWSPSSTFVTPTGVVTVVGNQDDTSTATPGAPPSEILAEIVTLTCEVIQPPTFVTGEIVGLLCEVLPPERVFIREYLFPFIVELTCQVLTPPDYSILLTGAKGGLYTDLRRAKILREDDELLKLGVL